MAVVGIPLLIGRKQVGTAAFVTRGQCSVAQDRMFLWSKRTALSLFRLAVLPGVVNPIRKTACCRGFHCNRRCMG